jgi:hypothetical protein
VDRVDELDVDAHGIPGPPHAAVHHVAHAQAFGGLAHLGVTSLELKDRAPGDDEEPGHLGQVRDQVVSQPVDEVVLFGPAAHVPERQNRKRRLARQGEGHALEGRCLDPWLPGAQPCGKADQEQQRQRSRRPPPHRRGPPDRTGRLADGSRLHPDPVSPHRLANVLEPLLALGLDGDVELALEMVVGRARDQHATGIGELLQASGDVHPVTVEVAVGLMDHVAKIDADPQAYALRLRPVCLALGHAPLDQHRTAHGVDDAPELDQRPIAHELDDAALVLGDERLEELLAVRLEPRERTVLVALHEA